jgi:retron-type reverse transcriptase
VRVSEVFPEFKPINTGVTQGSKLTPLLFNIFLSDLLSNENNNLANAH